jgi:hypothetical protein
MTFRLVNQGRPERWLRDEYLYHVWHPNESGINCDYHGPHDGLFMSLRALEARALGRIEPWLENPWIRQARAGDWPDADRLLRLLAERDEPSWRVGNQPPTFGVFCLEGNYRGFDLYLYQGRWFGLRPQEGYFDPRRTNRYRVLLEGFNLLHLKQVVDYYIALPTGLWDRLKTQPLYRLPLRAARRIGKELARIWG